MRVCASSVVVEVIVVPVDVSNEFRTFQEGHDALFSLVFREAVCVGDDVAGVEAQSNVVHVDVECGLLPVLWRHPKILVALRPVDLIVWRSLDVVRPIGVAVFEDELDSVLFTERPDLADALDHQVVSPL